MSICQEMTDDKNIKIKVNELLYYSFLLVLSVSKGLGFYEGMKIYSISLIIAGGCILAKIVCEKYNVAELVIIVGLILIGLIVYKNTGNLAALIYIVMIIGIKNIPVKRVFLLEGSIWGACFLIRAVLGMSGISRGLVLVHEKLGMGPIIRWSFGYPHPNVLQITYAVIAAFILYNLNYEGKRLFKLLLILFMGNCFVFLYSVSYTGFILTTGLLIIYFYFVIRKKRSKLENILIECVLPFCVLFAVVLPLAMEHGSILAGIDDFMNKLFNTRFLASRVYLYEGPRLLGRDVSDIGFALDCSYVYLLMNGGILLFIIILGIYFFFIHQCIRNNKNREIAITLTFLIAGVSEPFLFNTSFKNITFFFLGNFMFDLLKGSKESWGIINLNEKFIYLNSGCVKEVQLIIRNIFKKKLKYLCGFGILSAAIALVFFLTLQPKPEAIFVGADNTDCGKHQEIYMTEDEIRNQNYIIYEYHGQNAPLYRFEGNIIRLEIIRDGLSSIFLGYIIGVIILLTIYSFFFWHSKDIVY